MGLLRPLQVPIFATGMFYAYPWKVAMHLLYGDGYAVAYTHFRRDHHTWLNLIAHTLCLFLQVLGNFGLLLALDRQGGLPWMMMTWSTVAALSWVQIVGAREAPLLARVLATACIVSAAFIAPHLADPVLLERSVMAGFIVLFMVCGPLSIKGKGGTVPLLSVSLPLLAKIFGGVTLFFHAILPALLPVAAPLKTQLPFVLSGTVSLLAILSLVLKEPTAPVTIAGLVVCRLGAILTGSDLMYWLSIAFFASVCQGISHKLSGEQATMLALEKGSSSAPNETVGYQYAHCTFFPTLVFQSLLASAHLI